MKEDLTEEKLLAQIENTDKYIAIIQKMIEKSCDRLNISAEDADYIYHLVEMLKFHRNHKRTQLTTFERLFDKEAPR